MEGIPGNYWRNSDWPNTQNLGGLHLKSAWHFVQKNAANRNIYTTVRSKGDLMRNSHLYLKSRKIKWPSSGKAQSLKLVEGCNPNDFGRISSLSLA